MSDGWIGEIRGFAGNFAPQNWMLCQGQLLQIQQYNALYSILGITFGGNGSSNFNLPNFAGRVPVGSGQLYGTSSYFQLGSVGGAQTHVLSQGEMPVHTHAAQTSGGTAAISGSVTAVMNVNNDEAEGKSPSGTFLSVSSSPDIYAGSATSGQTLNANAITVNTSGLSVNVSGIGIQIGAAGSSSPVSLMQPYQVINWIICINGIYPSRP
jgi:microcystin-dependent protein